MGTKMDRNMDTKLDTKLDTKMSLAQDERRWLAIQSRDASYDDTFCYGVITTGVYCKPSCKSRLPLRRNVKFFLNTEAAETFGLRACKKCNPSKTAKGINEAIHALCRYIETHVDETVSLARIAKKSGYSADHIRKVFAATVGSSPKAYQQGLRRQKLTRELKVTAHVTNVTGAIFSAGYGSTSRVYETIEQNIGMTPNQYRRAGRDVLIHYASGDTSLGVTMIAATERGICFLQIGDSGAALLAELKKEFPEATIKPMPNSAVAQFEQWMDALNQYLAQKQALNKLPLDIRGTAFQMLVWRYLQSIPAGEVRSYGEVAKAIGKPAAVRAVASACARNNIALAIPCHRVVRGDGGVAGFRWGVERKRALIAHERGIKK